ncbi:MAG: glutamate--tRNA ligase [Euryarchaeota archaeon]|nr:glutamate--tRNA ligase [Euryarchaeota archaeon]MBU4139874.1 glutamate--tRNA ligase [Euryarchaeota archaeon]
MPTTEDIKLIIKKFALQNAVKYDKTPQAGAVMGKVMAQPELRSKAKEITVLVNEVLVEIDQMTPEAREEELNKLAPELIAELSEKKEPEKGLPPLEIDGPLVMRFAPNPNGPPTLGSARGIVVNSEYTKKYKGKLIIRFDDTDPATKRPMLEAYTWYLEDCEWLGAKPDEVVIASDRMERYYEVAEQLLTNGGAYVCFCAQETFKALKDAKSECPHRNESVEKNLESWKKMVSGEYKEQEAVLRIKTDITHKDPALRDWVAFRIIKTPHPRPEVLDKYCAWPLLDFEGAVEDHLLGTTLIIRGKDLIDSEKRQKYVYDHMGWTYPRTTHWGRVQIHEFGKLSTSGIKKAIAEGIYTGWDDPRLPTIRAIKRRGILPEALRKFMLDLGLGETDISLSLDTLYAENRKIIDPIANRYFFVWDPVELEIEGAEPRIAKAPIHPTRGGLREIPAGTTVFITGNDADSLKNGERLRLKDLYNIEVTCISPPRAKFIGTDMDLVKKEKARIIHWVPLDGLKVRVLSPDREFIGVGERGMEREVDKVVQFERFGFVRIDSAKGDGIVAYFTHK